MLRGRAIMVHEAGEPNAVPLALDQTARSFRMISAARSPMMTQGAMVLPVVTFGMIEPSAMRSPSMP